MPKKKWVVLGFLALISPVLVFGAKSETSTQNIQISADIFELDAKTNLVVASGNVVVTQKDMKILGRMAEFDQKKKVVKLTDHVTLTRGNVTLSCAEIVAYGQESRVEAMGGVQFQSEELHGRSEKALYDFYRQTIRLEGEPRAWKGTDEVSGRVILVDLKRNKMTTQGNAKMVLDLEQIR